MRVLMFVSAVSALLLSAAAAQAHAHLDHADPAAGSTVPSAPREISLWFTEDLEPAFSGVTVTDDSGDRVDAGKPSVSGNVMRVPLTGGGTGTYHVLWHALSVDTHKTEGSFTFQVRP